jgi:hypothetical protein
MHVLSCGAGRSPVEYPMNAALIASHRPVAGELITVRHARMLSAYTVTHYHEIKRAYLNIKIKSDGYILR